MYKPVMFMASDHHSTIQQESSRILFGFEDSKKPESSTTKTSSSKGKAKRSATKKNPKNSKQTPQRGVGVAQLERLRLQQRLNNKLTEIQPKTQVVQTDNQNHHNHFQYYQNPTDSLHSTPVIYGASKYGGFVAPSNVASPEFGYGYNFQGLVNIGTVSDNSSGLCSIPTMKKQRDSSALSSEYCISCHNQKKRVSNCGNNTDFDGSQDAFPVITTSGHPGFEPPYISNVRLAGETGTGVFNGGTYLSRRPSLVDESVEVRAVHRKGKNAGGHIMMEYEFFPDHHKINNSEIAESDSRVSSGTYPMEHELVASSANSCSVGRSPEASDQHVGHVGGASYVDDGAAMHMMMMSSCYSPVDLSLKLSF